MASIFKGFLLRIPRGYFSAREQDELIRFVLEHVRFYPRSARETQAVLAEELDTADLSPKTLELEILR